MLGLLCASFTPRTYHYYCSPPSCYDYPPYPLLLLSTILEVVSFVPASASTPFFVESKDDSVLWGRIFISSYFSLLTDVKMTISLSTDVKTLKSLVLNGDDLGL